MISGYIRLYVVIRVLGPSYLNDHICLLHTAVADPGPGYEAKKIGISAAATYAGQSEEALEDIKEGGKYSLFSHMTESIAMVAIRHVGVPKKWNSAVDACGIVVFYSDFRL